VPSVPSALSWAALLGLVSVCGHTAGCASNSTGATCDTQNLPPTDPCYKKSCCETVRIGADGGVVSDDAGDAGTDAGPITYRMCGACNG
jgi:hypothetical protein